MRVGIVGPQLLLVLFAQGLIRFVLIAVMFSALPLLLVQPSCSKALGQSLGCSTQQKAGKSPCFVWVLCWGALCALWKRLWLVNQYRWMAERARGRDQSGIFYFFFLFSYEWGFLSWRWIVNNSFLLPKKSIEQLICVSQDRGVALMCFTRGWVAEWHMSDSHFMLLLE